MLPMLAVDKNIEISLREQAEWKSHGIDTVRVDTMQEALEKLMIESFLFIAINADNVNYLPLLSVMRNTVTTLIYIIDSSFTKAKEIEALHHGADIYTQFNNDVTLNVQLALAHLLRHHDRDIQSIKPSGLTIYDNFLVLANSRRIFYRDERINLTKTEYKMLHCFIINHDIVLTYKQIYRIVWGEDIQDNAINTLRNFVLKLRKKIAKMTGGYAYIETERDIGYIFSSQYGK